MCSRGAWMDWYILTCTKREPNQIFQHVLRGSIDNIMYIKGREYLGLPFALDVKGGQCLGVVVAIKSKGEYCWHYDIGVVLSLMATHSDERSQYNRLTTKNYRSDYKE